MYDTPGVKTLNIPANVRNIYLKGLNSDSLEEINVDKNNPSFTSQDGILYTEDMTILIRVPRAKDVSAFAIPSDVTEILSFAFESCDSLKRIVIPETVTKIDDCAFYLCHNLSSVTILNSECVIDDEYNGEDGVTFCNTCIYPNGNYLGIIQGYDNSTAEKYAQQYDRTFVSLGTNPASTTTITITTTASITTTPPITTEPAYSLGDVNGDGSVDSTDASAVLAEYAAIQTGNESSFTDKQEEVANVNMDGTIDSSDASVILSYYAYLSTGGTLSMEDYLNPPTEKGFDIKDYPVYGLQLSTIKQSASDFDKCMENELCILYSYKDPAIKFALVDLNSDESPELIVTSGELGSGSSIIAEVYTLIDNSLVKLCQSAERAWYYMCEDNVIASSNVMGQGYGYCYYNYQMNSELNLIEYVFHDYTTEKKVIQHSSGKILTEEEAAEIQEKYVEIALELIEL